MMEGQPIILGGGLTKMVKSVIKDLVGTAGLVRASLLLLCGDVETNPGPRERPGALPLLICLLIHHKNLNVLGKG